MKGDVNITLTFDEENHIYRIDGKIIPSVTEICQPITAGKYGKVPALSAAAAHRGTIVHELCELYDYGALPDEIEPDAVPYLKAWVQFCSDYQPDWIAIEHMMAHPFVEFGETAYYAGTVDRVGWIDGHLTFVDIKTTASLDRVSKISLACQLIAYEDLFDSEKANFHFRKYRNKSEYENVLGVQLCNNGTYKLHDAKEIQRKYDFSAWDVFSDLFSLNLLLKGGRK